jgi:hypothetical protein
VLSWIKRLEIAIDSARGIWFLHTYQGGCIVHRDIKVNFYYYIVVILRRIHSTMFIIATSLTKLYIEAM